MLIDSFIYYNEAPVVDFRINELKDVVDKFVVLSGTTSWRGNPNPYQFPAHLHEIADIDVHRLAFPDDLKLWDAERWLRNQMGYILKRFGSRDVIIFSDADEFARPEVAAQVDSLCALEIDQYYYNFHTYIRHHDCMFAAKVRELRAMYSMRFEWQRTINGVNTRGRRNSFMPVIEAAGWEFSFFGDSRFIQNKLKNYSHTEIDLPEYSEIAEIERRMANGIDIIDRPIEGAPKGPLPQYVLANKDKYPQFWRKGANANS